MAVRIEPVLPEPGRRTEPPDPYALQFEQTVVTVALLAGFVFRIALVIPAVALLLAVPLFAGPRGNVFGRGYAAMVRHRQPKASRRAAEAPAVTQFTRLVEVVLLVTATMVLAFGLTTLAWVFALPVAAITGLAATTGINVVAMLRDRR